MIVLAMNVRRSRTYRAPQSSAVDSLQSSSEMLTSEMYGIVWFHISLSPIKIKSGNFICKTLDILTVACRLYQRVT